MVFDQLVSLFQGNPDRARAQNLYLAIVGQSRKPLFYEALHVPDTLDGRFELILLHMFFVINRLKEDKDENAHNFNQSLIDCFFDDMDRSLREMGVSDTGVGKRIKAMAGAFYGRMKAYERGLKEEQALQESLLRNLYGTTTASQESILRMADYVRMSVDGLKRQKTDEIRESKLAFIQANKNIF